MNLIVNQIHRCARLPAATLICAAMAVLPAGAYALRDNDPRAEEITAALPEAKASTAVVAKAVHVDDVKDLVAAKAAAHGVPGELARAVVQVESDYDTRMTGSVGEVGLMQIKYETARLLGYTGTLWELYEPETNVEWGMRYLAGARRLADGDLCGTVMRYNGGHGRRQMSRATTIYCNKVKRVLGLPPEPVPVADTRDDGPRKDADKKDDKRNEKTAAKRETPAGKVAAAERKTEPATRQAKAADRKQDGKATSTKAADTKAAKPDTKTAKADTKPDTRTATSTARDKSGDRKIAAAERENGAAARRPKLAEPKQAATAKTTTAKATTAQTKPEPADKKSGPSKTAVAESKAPKPSAGHAKSAAKKHDRKQDHSAVQQPGERPAPAETVPANGGGGASNARIRVAADHIIE